VQPIKRFQVRGAPGEVVRIQLCDRYVDYWAPPEPTTHLIVAHDGQIIFDKSTSTYGQIWKLAKSATKVFKNHGFAPPLIIGVFHSSSATNPGGRAKDLAPQDIFQNGVTPRENFPGIWPTPERKFPISELRGNRYQADIVESIIPTITSAVGHTLNPANTAMLGASMGGLATLYGVSKYPEIYRTALAFSTHWSVGMDPLVSELMASLPPAGTHKLWMSRGTKALDAGYGPYQEYANNIAVSRGYRYGRDLATPVYQRTTHNEKSWSSYVTQALEFWISDRN